MAKNAKRIEKLTAADEKFLEVAFRLAEKSYKEGGLPIGAVLVKDGTIIGRGHNKRVQRGDPIAHGEMDCMRNAGRQSSYKDATMYTTLSPCMMCSGTIVQFGISRLIIGENKNFGGNERFLRSRGISVLVARHEGCTELMKKFIRENPTLWDEDIGVSH